MKASLKEKPRRLDPFARSRLRLWTRALLLTAFIGFTAGFALRELNPVPEAKGTSVLWEFSFSDLVSKAGPADWKVIEDRIFDGFPPLSRSKRIARRIVAEAMMPSSAQAAFVKKVQEAAVASLAAHGAAIKGQVDSSSSSVDMHRGERIATQLELPRRYYTVGQVQGVADYWCIAGSGRVMIIVSIMEGL
jgi:hypothetical protein